MVGKVVNSRATGTPAVWAVDRYGPFAALAGADGAIAMFDTSKALANPQRSKVNCKVHAPLCSLALAPKRGRVAAYADRAGNVYTPSSETPVAELPGGTRHVTLDASHSYVLAAGGSSKEVVVIPRNNGSRASDASSPSDQRNPEPKRFSVAQNHRSAISAMAIAPGESAAVVCGQAITLVELRTGDLLRRYVGHQTPVSAVAFLPKLKTGKEGRGELFFVSACAGDQFLSVWPARAQRSRHGTEASPTKKRRKSLPAEATAVQTLISPEKGARSIVADRADDDDKCVSLCAVLPSGAVAVWKEFAVSSESPAVKCSFVLRPSEGDSVMFAAFPKRSVLVIARGHPMQPEYFTVDLTSVDTTEITMPKSDTQGLLTNPITGAPTSISQKSLLRTDAAAPVAAKGAAVAAKQTDGVQTGSEQRNGHLHAEKLPRNTGAEDDSSEEDGAEGSDRAFRGDADDDSDEELPPEPEELTLQERLLKLGPKELEGRGEQVAKLVASDPETNPGRIDSVSNVLIQAVRTKDEKLFESVVDANRNIVQIRSTIRRMQATMATHDFLEMLVARLLARPLAADVLHPWIYELFMEHAGAFLSQPSSPALDELVRHINMRVENMPRLCQLEGRLELILKQAERVSKVEPTYVVDSKPVVEFVVQATTAREDGIESDESSDSSDSEGEDDADETGDFSEEGSDSSSMENELDEDGGGEGAGPQVMLDGRKRVKPETSDESEGGEADDGMIRNAKRRRSVSSNGVDADIGANLSASESEAAESE